MERIVERLLFASRWLLVPLYVGLALVLALFVVQFFIEIVHLAQGLAAHQEIRLPLSALAMLDLVLMASLIVMVMLSGFESFVAKITLDDSQSSLLWLTKLDVGSIKVKIVTSIAVISAVDLLRTFLEVDGVANDKLLWLVVIHGTLVATAIAFAAIERMSEH